MKQVCIVFWSATGNTKKIVEKVGSRIAECLKLEVVEFDCTNALKQAEELRFSNDDIVVVGVPTYAGKIPNKILPWVSEMLKGNKTPVVPIVTFGNRSYDNSLAELTEKMKSNDFRVLAAGAFRCRHAFSPKLAGGHPNNQDFYDCMRLADGMVRALSEEDFEKDILVPGDAYAPYYTPLGIDGEPKKFLKAKPKTKENCTFCGRCVEVCPMNSISGQDPSIVEGVCIKCQACIRTCPTQSKFFDDPAFLSHVLYLEQNYRREAANELFIN